METNDAKAHSGTKDVHGLCSSIEILDGLVQIYALIILMGNCLWKSYLAAGMSPSDGGSDSPSPLALHCASTIFLVIIFDPTAAHRLINNSERKRAARVPSRPAGPICRLKYGSDYYIR